MGCHYLCCRLFGPRPGYLYEFYLKFGLDTPHYTLSFVYEVIRKAVHDPS